MKYAVEFSVSQQNPVEIVNALPDEARILFNYLSALDNKHARIFCCQATLAKLIGLTTKTVRKYLKLLKATGFIYYHRRGPWRSCLYYINPIFYQYDLRVKLQSVFSSFNRIATGLLKSSLQSVISAIPTINSLKSKVNFCEAEHRRDEQELTQPTSYRKKNTHKRRATYAASVEEQQLYENSAIYRCIATMTAMPDRIASQINKYRKTEELASRGLSDLTEFSY